MVLVLCLILFFMVRKSSNTTDTATPNREESKVARIEKQTEPGDRDDRNTEVVEEVTSDTIPAEVAKVTAKNRSEKILYTHYSSIATTQAISHDSPLMVTTCMITLTMALINTGILLHHLNKHFKYRFLGVGTFRGHTWVWNSKKIFTLSEKWRLA